MNILKFLKNPPSLDMGDSMNFLGAKYYRNPEIKCNINDEVIIHPVPGKSQATKSYPAKIVSVQINGQDGKAKGSNIWILSVRGIKDNKNYGAKINDYLFSRLEFVKRNCKE